MHRQSLKQLLQIESVEGMDRLGLGKLIVEELPGDHLPRDFYRIDPRTLDRIIYSDARTLRPHDNRIEQSEQARPNRTCVICRGETTGIVDVAELSEGFTFINKNLFPVVFPFDQTFSEEGEPSPREVAQVSGLHLLQWTSSQHDKDWHNMPRNDRVVVMSRLALLEGALLRDHSLGEQTHSKRYVSIIKNYGSEVGASLEHGHQQIILSSVKPRALEDHERFLDEWSEPFPSYVLKQTAAELVVKDYGDAVLLVPDFMRRPYAMLLLLKDSAKSHLYELTSGEVEAVAEGWHDVTRAFHVLMESLGKPIAYNITMHSGTGQGVYFEFLPYTQPMGGLEHLGLYVCQETPERAADWLSDFLEGDGKSA
jgi:galactose-1-phosphate uridylyltransferase